MEINVSKCKFCGCFHMQSYEVSAWVDWKQDSVRSVFIPFIQFLGVVAFTLPQKVRDEGCRKKTGCININIKTFSLLRWLRAKNYCICLPLVIALSWSVLQRIWLRQECTENETPGFHVLLSIGNPNECYFSTGGNYRTLSKPMQRSAGKSTKDIKTTGACRIERKSTRSLKVFKLSYRQVNKYE